jgi:hypothetical protein
MGDEPLFKRAFVGRYLTHTGATWLYLPFVFIFWKKLKFSLIEFMITVVCCALGSGFFVSWLVSNDMGAATIVIAQYLGFHTHFLALSGCVYLNSAKGRSWKVALHQIVLALGWLVVRFATVSQMRA